MSSVRSSFPRRWGLAERSGTSSAKSRGAEPGPTAGSFMDLLPRVATLAPPTLTPPFPWSSGLCYAIGVSAPDLGQVTFLCSIREIETIPQLVDLIEVTKSILGAIGGVYPLHSNLHSNYVAKPSGHFRRDLDGFFLAIVFLTVLRLVTTPGSST